MKIRHLLQTALLLGAWQTASAETCHPYMPEKTTIQGTLSQETLPGPPNHKSVEEGDAPETHFFLNLEPPVCVTPNEGSKANKHVPSISKIQLTFRGETGTMHEKLKPHVGAGVRCAGYFFSWHRPHHHTQVLMMTRECDPITE